MPAWTWSVYAGLLLVIALIMTVRIRRVDARRQRAVPGADPRAAAFAQGEADTLRRLRVPVLVASAFCAVTSVLLSRS